jgi:hypothetical protein
VTAAPPIDLPRVRADSWRVGAAQKRDEPGCEVEVPVGLSRRGGEGVDDDIEASEIFAHQVERVFGEHGNVRPGEFSDRVRLS